MAKRLDLSFGAHDLVTGEAVSLELPAASIGVRILSGLIDVVAVVVAAVVLAVLGGTITRGQDQALTQTAQVVVALLAVLVLPTTVETLTRGKSPGKLALGLRTVRDDAGPIQFRHAFVRALVGMVEIFVTFGVPALISALVSTQAKRLGDHAAGTYVVRERVAVRLTPPPAMPPFLQAWASGADIATLPDGLAVNVRQFLGRASTLTPAARAAVGSRLCAEALRHVAPPPSAGAHPEHVLAAVLADRRRRDGERLDREEQLRQRLLPPDPLDLSR
ncbi:RDD family protein [Segeticoccus rhizosphaerae]|jgi:uncharacterized RDD family membrane protein YckC|uniref:RDD family protein n=2 Tax=Segeticoccus rhizosphaerae TaxID=1104777 RepID=UPI0010C03A3F|nr:RDD family protein [Ornithinicoccus soli]HEX5427496.1 RDD family protein [Pedococcus sp.]